jgi:hypothetical protein
MEFIALRGDDLGVAKTENYRLVETFNGHIVFSYTKQGEAMVVHFASDKKGLRKLKKAFKAFCEWIFINYNWCRMIIGAIDKESVKRMVSRCDCFHIANCEGLAIYTRLR